MQIARVIGTVVSTVKNESLTGRKFLIVQTLDADLKKKGKPMVALDSVGAGVGVAVDADPQVVGLARQGPGAGAGPRVEVQAPGVREGKVAASVGSSTVVAGDVGRAHQSGDLGGDGRR